MNNFDSVDFSFDLLVGATENIIRGERILQQVIHGNWIVIDPRTKNHCVADSIACIELWKSSDPICSAFGYIKR